MGFAEEEKMKEVFDDQVGKGICQAHAGETLHTGRRKHRGGPLEEN